MALLTSRGFGRAANEGFGTGFAGALQLLLQQKSEALQRELEGQRAKQAKEQFDQQMATTREQFDREMLFKEYRANKADVVSEIERLTMQKNRSEDVSDRNARALEERSDREARQRIAEEQLGLQREELGVKKSESEARINEANRRSQPIGSLAEALNKQIGAMIFDPTDTQETVDVKSKALVTGQQVKASGSAAENETKRTGIESQKLEIMKQDRDRAAVESLWSKVGDERDKLRTSYERATGQSVEAQLDVLKNLAANALDENERRRYLSVMSDLTSAKSVEERAAASDRYAAEVMTNRVKSDPAWKTLVAGLEEPLREKFMSEFSKSAETEQQPKESNTSLEANTDADTEAVAQARKADQGIIPFTMSGKTWDVDTSGFQTRLYARSTEKQTMSEKQKWINSVEGKKAMTIAFEELRAEGRGKGWATTFEKAMNNEAFRNEITKKALAEKFFYVDPGKTFMGMVFGK